MRGREDDASAEARLLADERSRKARLAAAAAVVVIVAAALTRARRGVQLAEITAVCVLRRTADVLDNYLPPRTELVRARGGRAGADRHGTGRCSSAS